MRTSGRSVGPRGVTLLLVTALAGIALGAHGWLDRKSGVAHVALGSGPPSAAALLAAAVQGTAMRPGGPDAALAELRARTPSWCGQDPRVRQRRPR